MKGDVNLFEVNDLIMYGGTGVCRVEEITKPNFGGGNPDMLYYILNPLYQNGTIYAPVDNEKVYSRLLMSEEEVNQLIDSIPEIHTTIYKSSSIQQLSKHYQEVIDSHDSKGLMEMAKSIYLKNKIALEQNKHLGAIDKKFMKRVEELLFGEFAAVLKIDRENVKEYIDNRLENQSV